MDSPLRVPKAEFSRAASERWSGLPDDLRQRLAELGQQHVLDWWPTLNFAMRAELIRQLRSLDFSELAQCCAEIRRSFIGAPAGGAGRGVPSESHAVLEPPKEVVELDGLERRAHRRQWARLGERTLRTGEVAAVVVAGGMGTRLGCAGPKGLFPVGPVTGKPLFQWHVEQIAALRRRLRASIPLVVMTSSHTHDATVEAFHEHHRWGLPAEDVYFVRQGDMPAFDRRTGRLLMAAPHRLLTSPDGHGGLFEALRRTGLLEHLRERGIRRMFYFQVDNPGTRVCDPEFLGCHLAAHAEVSVRVIRKRTAAERVGIVVSDGRSHRIVEYIDLPAQLAAEESPPGSGRLRLWAGNMAVHVFELQFLQRCAQTGIALPWHYAVKPLAHFSSAGRWERPTEPNAIKPERFIFDLLSFSDRVLVVEADRDREYLPLKNRTGDNSPQTVRAGLIALAAERIRRLGGEVAPQVAVEIAPSWSNDRLARALAARPRVVADTYFGDGATGDAPE